MSDAERKREPDDSPDWFERMSDEQAAPDAGDLVAIPDIDPISDPRNADGLIKQLRHAAITDSNATTASPYVCKLLVFAANTIAVLSSNTPCCQDWENCRDRCVPLAEYWKKQAATIAALQEEISRLTDNQRQQDSAAKREAREDSMKAKVKKVSLCHGPIPDTDLPVTDAKPVAWMGWKLNRDVDDSETRFATVSEAIAFRDSWREIVPLYTSPPDLAEARELVRECLTVANFSSIPAQDTQKRCINFLARTK